MGYHSEWCRSLSVCKRLITPTKGETGNYAESDYVRDAYGNPTSQLKPGAENLLSYDDIDFDDNNIGPTGFGIGFRTLVPLTNGMIDWTFSASLLEFGIYPFGTIQSKLR